MRQRQNRNASALGEAEPRTLLTLAEVGQRLCINRDGRSVRAALRRLGVPVLLLGHRTARVDAVLLERALSEGSS